MWATLLRCDIKARFWPVQITRGGQLMRCTPRDNSLQQARKDDMPRRRVDWSLKLLGIKLGLASSLHCLLKDVLDILLIICAACRDIFKIYCYMVVPYQPFSYVNLYYVLPFYILARGLYMKTVFLPNSGFFFFSNHVSSFFFYKSYCPLSNKK